MKALIFDLDGTLVDSVYSHVVAFKMAFAEAGMEVEGWRIHHHIGMSGRLLTQAMARAAGRKTSPEKLHQIDERHSDILRKQLPRPEPLPGAVKLLRDLRRKRILLGIATSGKPADMKTAVKGLQLDESIVMVNSQDAEHAKPEPDLFLVCQQRLGVPARECYVVGDAMWDILAARRAGMLGIGLLTGGYGRDELLGAGAYRVFENPADLHDHVGELGLSPRE